MKPRDLGTEAGKLVAVVAVAGIAGAGVGLGLSEVRGEDSPAPLLPPAGAVTQPAGADTTPRTTPREPARTTTQPSSAPSSGEEEVRLRVVSAELQPASTPDGQERGRARTTIVVRLSNGTSAPVTPDPTLIVGEDRIQADLTAADEANGLFDELPATTVRSGELRFETSGAVTQQLQEIGRATLRIGGLARRVTIEQGEAVEGG